MAVETISLLSPIAAGHEEAVRATLATFERGTGPFVKVPGTHVARFVVINWLGTGDPTRRRRLRPARLLFSAVVDGPVEGWLWGMFEKQGPVVETVWRHCSGWPAAEERQARARWLLDQRLAITYPLVANDATVAEIQHGLKRRDALRGLKAKASLLTPAELRAAYDKAMTEVRR